MQTIDNAIVCANFDFPKHKYFRCKGKKCKAMANDENQQSASNVIKREHNDGIFVVALRFEDR